jgi:hypothetical protein
MFAALLSLLACSQLSADELSTASVAERIIKDEGYQLFRFAPEAAQPFQLSVRLNGVEKTQDSYVVPGVKECVVAVRLGKNNRLEAVRVYYDRGMVSAVFPPNHFPEFNGSMSQAKIELNAPFLTLKDARAELEILLRSK